MGTPPAWSLAMRSRSMSVHTTSCPASARQAPVTSPTYPHPMTERRNGKPPSTELNGQQPARFLVPLVLCAIQEKEKSPSYLRRRRLFSLVGKAAPAFAAGLGAELRTHLATATRAAPLASDYNSSMQETRTRV